MRHSKPGTTGRGDLRDDTTKADLPIIPTTFALEPQIAILYFRDIGEAVSCPCLLASFHYTSSMMSPASFPHTSRLRSSSARTSPQVL